MKKNIKTMKKNKSNSKLEHINPLVTGIDVGANSVHVCIGHSDGGQEVKEFPTFTRDLKAMVAWLKENNNASAAMESTGVYWIPVYDILAQEGIDVTLANAHHIRNLSGKKTDIQDCQWIQQLHSYGLLRGSFRPDDAGVIFRNYVRQRARLVKSASIQIQLMHKALVQMNIQLNQVLSDITGITGMRIIRAIIAGERNPGKLAKLRDARCKKNESDVAKSLEGNFRNELIFNLCQAVEAYDFFCKQIEVCEQEIKKILRDFDNNNDNQNQDNDSDISATLAKMVNTDITKIPGISENTATTIISEIGCNMLKWPTEKHFTSWLGLCPENKISGNKVLKSNTKKTANKASQALRIAANAVQRTQTALGAFFRRIRSRKGAAQAITATAHKIAKIIYSMIRQGKNFKEMGQDFYEQKYKKRVVNNLKRKAKSMGFKLVES